MRVPFLKKVFIFIQSYLIFTTSSVSGLPFTSISSITSLKSSAESLSSEDSSSPAVVNLTPTSSETSTLVSTSPHFKLLISSPNVINVNLLSQNSSPSRDVTLNSEETFYEFRGPKTTLLLTPIAQKEDFSSVEVSKLSSELDSSVNNAPSSNLLTSSVESFGTASNLDIDFSSADSKREARNTKFVTLRPFTNNQILANSESSKNDCSCETTAAPFVGLLQSNFINNSFLQSSKTFSSFPSGFLPNPIRSPCLKVPINLSRSPPLSSTDNNLESEKSPADFVQSNSLSSSISNSQPFSNGNSYNFFQTGLLSPQKSISPLINIDNFIPSSSNITNSLFSFTKPFSQTNTISNSALESINQFRNRYSTLQNSFSSNSGSDNFINSFENIDSPSESPFTGSQNFKSFVSDNKPITVQFPPKTVNLQKISQAESNVLPNEVSQVNNHYINPPYAGNNINNNIPFTFKTSPQTFTLNQNNNKAFQSETVTINNNLISIPNNNVIYSTNNLKLQKIPERESNIPTNQVSKVNNNFINPRDAVNNLKNIAPLALKTSPQTTILNQNNNEGCPQSETDTPNNNIVTVPNNNIIYQHLPSNNFNLPVQNNDGQNNPEIRLNREDQIERLKNSINAYNNFRTIPPWGQNSNQGCPQLISIPFNKPTLNRQINIKNNNNNDVATTKDQDCDIPTQPPNIEQKPQIVNNQNLNIALKKLNYIKALSQNQNNQGFPQLLPIQPPPQNNVVTSQSNLINVEDTIKNNNNEDLKNQNNNNLGCPQVIPTTYINNLAPQKIGNMATFTLNNNKINSANTQPVSNLENSQAKSLNCNNNNFVFQIPKAQVVNNVPSQNNDFNCQPISNNIVTVPNLAIKLSDSSNLKTPQSSLPFISPTNILTSQNTLNNNVPSISLAPSVQNICSNPGSNFLTIQNVSSKYFTPTTSNPFSYIPLDSNMGTLNNIPISLLNSPSCTCNVAPTVPTVSLQNLSPTVLNIPQTTYSNTESSVNRPFAVNQNSCYNNLQNLLSLQNRNINNPVSSNNFLNLNTVPCSSFEPVQSLPQVSFVNNIPSQYVPPITISLSDNQNLLCTLSNLPIICTSPLTSYTSYQPIITPCTMNPILSALLPQVNLGSLSLCSSLNSLVSTLTQNIMSKVISKASPSAPSNLPPVNTYTLTSDCNPDDCICFDISESLSPYLISTSSSTPRVSLPKIPIACNEYLPPLPNSQIIPINSEIFLSSVEPDSYDTFTPYSSDATVFILPSY